MTIEAIVQDLDKANQQLADVRARLVAERKKHEAAIRSIDTLIAGIPAPKATKAPSTAPAAPKQPSLTEAIVTLVSGQPGLTTSQLVAALPDRPKKSVENTASQLVTRGKLKREGSAIRVRHVAEVLAGVTDTPPIGEPINDGRA